MRDLFKINVQFDEKGDELEKIISYFLISQLEKYYFQEKTEQEIADEENATQQSVHIILERAIENLKKILKK